MSFDIHTSPLAPVFTDEPLVPGIEDDDDTGAGSDFYVWDNILPESAGQAHNVPNPMSVVGPGIDTGTSLAARLHWRVQGNADHEQVEIEVGESVISVDREMAEIVFLLHKAGIATATSCVGTEETWGYIMFIGADSAERFLQIWQRYLVPLGHPMPVLEFTARDAEWRADVLVSYPNPGVTPVDEEGLTYTGVWRDHRECVIEILPKLVWAVRRHLQESTEQQRPNRVCR